MTGGGTIAANRTLNVIGGDGITANANDMAITAAQTTITSIYNASLKVGRDAHNLIDFATTDDEVVFRIADADEIKMAANVLAPVTSDGAALGTTSLMWSDLFLASGSVINFNNGDVTLTHTSNTLTVAGGDLISPGIVTYSRSVHKTLSRLDISTSFLEISSDLRIQMTLTQPNVTFTLHLSRLRPNSKVLYFNIQDYNSSGTPSLIADIQPVYDVNAQEPVVIKFTLTGQTIGATIYATPIIKASGATAYLYRSKAYGFMEFTATEFSTAANDSSIGLLYAGD